MSELSKICLIFKILSYFKIPSYDGVAKETSNDRVHRN
jgi:hypothetical protein